MPEYSQSAMLAMALLNASTPPTPAGASGDATGIFDDEPMCMHSVTLASLHALNTGSQKPVWIDGRPRCVGISLKQIACAPFLAMRSTSLAARSASHSGMRHNGMLKPSLSPHHSSIIQLLYASTQASP